MSRKTAEAAPLTHKDITPKHYGEWRRAHADTHTVKRTNGVTDTWRIALSEAEAAKRFGVHARTWRRWEAGETTAPAVTRAIIAEDLNAYRETEDAQH